MLNHLRVENLDQLTERRKNKILRVDQHRLQNIRLVIQDVHHPHNVSACLRTADAFGISTIDVVTLKKKFYASTVAAGVEQWLNIHKFDNVLDCVTHLRNKGFKIAAALPPDRVPSANTHQEFFHHELHHLPLLTPIALVFGNEQEGIDPEWFQYLDYSFSIPMYGMVESFNISVACAITLYDVTSRVRKT